MRPYDVGVLTGYSRNSGDWRNPFPRTSEDAAEWRQGFLDALRENDRMTYLNFSELIFPLDFPLSNYGIIPEPRRG